MTTQTQASTTETTTTETTTAVKKKMTRTTKIAAAAGVVAVAGLICWKVPVARNFIMGLAEKFGNKSE